LSRRKLLELTTVILFVAASVADAASPYTLRIVVKTGDTIGGKTLTDFRNPAINDSGTIVFAGSFAGGIGIFTQSALLAKTGDTIGGKTLTDFPHLPGELIGIEPAINDSGVVAFLGSFAGGDGIFTQSALLAKTGDTIDGKALTHLLSRPAINDSGVVPFLASWAVDGIGIFTQSALLVKQGDTISGNTLTSIGVPAINGSGAVAFGAKFAGDTQQGIFTQSAVLAKTGDTIGGRTLFEVGIPVINDSGSVAFPAIFDGGTAEGISTPSTLLVITPGGTIAGKTLTFGGAGPPAINGSGTVVFQATFDGFTGAGIFTPSTLLAKTGDTVGGKTLTTITGPASINDRGVVVFLGSFADSSSAIIAVQPFAGIPGQANCHGQSVSALSQQFGSMDAAAAALGYTSVQALQSAIKDFCK
jgi:hypothetical protein